MEDSLSEQEKQMQERLKFQVVFVYVCFFSQGPLVNWYGSLRARSMQRDLLRVFAFIAKVNAVTLTLMEEET